MSQTREEERYTGRYNRLFPMKPSVNSFITIYVLYLLDKHEDGMYGKEMMNEMTKRFKGAWSPSHGLVYPILSELEKEGIVDGKWDRGSNNRNVRKYAITEAGRAFYQAKKKEAESSFTESLIMIELFMMDVYEGKSYDFSDLSDIEEE